MTAHNVPGKLRKLAFAGGIALSLSAAAASVLVEAPHVSSSTRCGLPDGEPAPDANAVGRDGDRRHRDDPGNSETTVAH